VPATDRVVGDRVGSADGIRPTWKDSDRLVPKSFVRPALRFAKVEAAGGVVMLTAAIAALIWANSPWHAGYEQLLTTPFILRLGDAIDVELDLHGLVNEGLMTLFFLLAGLEIKRQLVTGELRDRRAAALPAIAALGGMLVPALIYAAINSGHAGSKGWGIPVATDIAFAVGVVTLVGSRVPIGARIFILTLAVVDDVGGIVVIAVFYASGVRPAWLVVGLGAVLVSVGLRRIDVRSMVPFLLLGAIAWYALYSAGVEAAIAGVIFGLITPIQPFHDPAHFGDVAHRFVERIEQSDEVAVEDLARYATETASPLERLENRLNLWVAFGIVPLFALANAGVRFDAARLDLRVALGVFLGLVVGKTLGVLGGSWLAVRTGVGRLPSATTWRHMFGLAITAGIGFTVALFVTALSFTDPVLTSSAKIGVLAASTVAGALGYLMLRALPTRAARAHAGPTTADVSPARRGRESAPLRCDPIAPPESSGPRAGRGSLVEVEDR
jgi:NhaA family Na+:H+ antiporter